MPWSGYWGSNVQAWLGSHGLGYPTQLWDDVPKSQKVTQDVLPAVGWTVEQAPVPLSDIAVAQSKKPIGLNKAVDVAKAAGLTPGFDIAMPSGETGVYSAAIYPDDLARERTFTSSIFRQAARRYLLPPVSDFRKSHQVGHQRPPGREFGRVNQFLMLAICLAIILSCVTGVVMWWKRRPSGRVGVPPLPPRRSVYIGLWTIATVFALAFPLTGLAILLMVVTDQAIIRTIPPLRRAFA